MPSTQSWREPILPLDPKLNCTLCRMNILNNLAYIDDEITLNFPPPVYDHNQVVVNNPGEGTPRRKPPTPLPQEYYREMLNITDSNGPLVLPPLPHGHTFVVTSSLMEMLTARGLFLGLPYEDSHTHIVKLRSVYKSCVGRWDLDMDIIGLRVFPLWLMVEAAIWFTKLPYNSIYTWEQFRVLFLARYYWVCKKLNHKDRVNNFVELLGESLSSSWDRFTSLLRTVLNHRIDDESLKDYF